MIVAVDAGHQRTEFAGRGLPAAEHDFMAGAALDLDPAIGAAGLIRGTQLFGNNALQRQLRSRLQNGLAVGFEMLDIADQIFRGLAPGRGLLLVLVLAEPGLAPGRSAIASACSFARQAADGEDLHRPRTTDRTRRTEDCRFFPRTARPAARRNPARRADRARRPHRQQAHPAASSPPPRWPEISRSSPGPCGS